MTRRFSLKLAVALACLPIYLLPAQPAPPRPYVVLVSLDGFRYDYAEKYQATRLLALGQAGAAADILPGVVLKPFANVDVFPFITRILGL